MVWYRRRTVNLAVVNGLDDNLGGLAVNAASNTVGSSEDLLDGSLQLLGEGLEAHLSGNIDDLIEGNRLVVLDVLLLLAVARRLLQGSDNQRRSSRNDRDSSLTVLDGKLDSYAQAFLLNVSVHI